MASRVLVPTPAGRVPEKPNTVSKGIVEVMCRVAHLPQDPEILPIQEIEPITLNAALRIREFLMRERLSSVIAVVPGFRSRRSCLIYRSVFNPAGISVSCVPVFGLKTPENWTQTWHGILEVTEQFLKLQYYRLFVL